MSSDRGSQGLASGAACAVAPPDPGAVTLGHGSGGRLTHRLLEQIVLPAFSNPYLDRRDDQAIVTIDAARIAFSTDSFVVTPLFFPGSDIGRLAVHGTVNDLAMGGARPLFLSASFILEEGLPLETLARVVASMRAAAEGAGVQIVTGDTKVVPRGSADRLFVNTAGIGVLPRGAAALSSCAVRPGDAVIVSGTLADHGMAVMCAREDLGLGDVIESDSAPLHGLVAAMLDCAAVRCLRDPTRGGLAASLREIAESSRVAFEIEEERLPVRPAVRAACELLGIDPMFVANEGKLVAFVAEADAARVLDAMRAHPLGADATRIGRASDGRAGEIVVRTCVGGRRLLELPSGEILPRIC